MSQLLFDIQVLENPKTPSSEHLPRLGRKSIRGPTRDQVEFRVACIDDLLPAEHRARDVWEYVSSLDLSAFQSDIKIMEGNAGPRTADPRIFLTLWLFGMLEGIASARHIARLCTMHHAYIWICGGVTVNYHSLSDFRTNHSDKFRLLLQESIALMWNAGIFKPEVAAQDGTRVKANAGGNSLRRQPTLTQYLKEAEEYLDQLEKELAANPAAVTLREKSRQERAARERKERLEQAHSEMTKYKEERIKSSKKNHNFLSQKDIDDMRTSTTDPECRKMKMGDGGYRPAYNVQFATSTDKKIILGVHVVNTLDPGTLAPMMQIVKENLEKIGCPMPSKWLADSAYANKIDAEAAETEFTNITLFSPPTGNGKVDAITPRKTDNPAMINLRTRMNTEEAQVIYKKRSSTAEFVNATSKNKGMREFLVRGLNKATSMALMYAIAHNMVVHLGNCY
jgi:transposase